MEIINEKEKAKINFQKTQAEKNYFLGEFKENVILAVPIERLDGKFLSEIVDAMKRSDAILLKIRRDVPLKNVKIYINEAEKLGIRYRLVDGLSFYGEIGLIVVSKDVLETNREILAKKRGYEYEENGLSASYADYEGEKLCDKHYKLLSEKLPSYLNKFKKINFMDKLLGIKCPICEEEKKGTKK